MRRGVTYPLSLPDTDSCWKLGNFFQVLPVIPSHQRAGPHHVIITKNKFFDKFAQILQHDLGYMELGSGDFLILFLILRTTLKVGITISHLQIDRLRLKGYISCPVEKSKVILGSDLSQVRPVTKLMLCPKLPGVLRNSIKTMAF